MDTRAAHVADEALELTDGFVSAGKGQVYLVRSDEGRISDVVECKASIRDS
jgi:hypothetical protein